MVANEQNVNKSSDFNETMTEFYAKKDRFFFKFTERNKNDI